jgi:hypothetical protein
VLQILPELPEHLWQHIAMYLIPQDQDPLQHSLMQQFLSGKISVAVSTEDAAQLAALQACLDVFGLVDVCMHRRPCRKLDISSCTIHRTLMPHHNKHPVHPNSVEQCVGCLRLPLQQLAQLQSLSVSGIGCLQLHLHSAAVPASDVVKQGMQQQLQRNKLAAAAEVTGHVQLARSSMLHLISLQLRSCKLAPGQSWEVLAGLPQLQHLELISVAAGDAATTAAAAAESLPFAAALASLQQLTSLKLQLSQRLDGSAIATARHLSKLKQLDLHRVGSQESPVLLQQLPCSLTGLSAFGCYYSTQDSSAAGSFGVRTVCQLTALRDLQLELCVAQGTDLVSVLLDSSSLQSLKYTAAAGDVHLEGDVEQLLAAVSGLVMLQQLQLRVAGLHDDGC